MKEYAKYVGLGFELVACILFFLWVGSKIDEWQGYDKPRFLIAGVFVGLFGAAYLMYRTIIQLGKPKDPE